MSGCPAKKRREAGDTTPREVDPDRPSDAELARILTGAKTVAVVGMNDTEGKAARSIPRILIEHGWNVIPVNPMYTEIAGRTSYASLTDVPVHIDLVDVFRRAELTPDIAREAVEVGADALWLQAGIRSAEAREIATAAGLTYVENACTGALARRLDLHPDAADEA